MSIVWRNEPEGERVADTARVREQGRPKVRINTSHSRNQGGGEWAPDTDQQVGRQ